MAWGGDKETPNSSQFTSFKNQKRRKGFGQRKLRKGKGSAKKKPTKSPQEKGWRKLRTIKWNPKRK